MDRFVDRYVQDRRFVTRYVLKIPMRFRIRKSSIPEQSMRPALADDSQ
jgi:hypothetical protein